MASPAACDAPAAMAALDTMASERAVHARFLPPGAELAEPAPVAAASDDDPFAEAFF